METQLLKYPPKPPSFKVKKENQQPTLSFSTCKSNRIFESKQQKNNLTSMKQEWKCQSQTNVIDFGYQKKPKFENLNLQFSPRSNSQSKKVLHHILSQSGNIFIDSEHESVKKSKQNPLTFKNKIQQPLQSIENRLNLEKNTKNYSCSIEKNKSPQTLKQMISTLKFNQKSSKLSNVASKQNINLKFQECLISSSPLHPLQKEVMQMKQEMKIIKSNSVNHNETIIKQRQQYQKMKQQFIQQINLLNQQIRNLNHQLVKKDNEFQQKSNIFLDEINQLIKDRHVLQIKLDSLIVPSQYEGSQKQKAFKELQLKLDQKDKMIFQLSNKNILLQSQISTLRFEFNNQKQKTQKFNPIKFQSQLNVFQQSLKYNIDEVSKYKSLLIAKDQQIKNIKQANEITKRQIERSKNEVSIQQLKRVTEIQNLKTIFQVEKTQRTNQIKDMNQEMEFLKNKIISLTKQIKQKDNFIVSRVKVIQK